MGKRKPETLKAKKKRYAEKHREHIKAYRRRHYLENREKLLRKSAEYHAAHPEAHNRAALKWHKAHYVPHPRPTRTAEEKRLARNEAARRSREGRQAEINARQNEKRKTPGERAKAAAYVRERRRTDPAFLIARRLRNRMWDVLRNHRADKRGHFRELVGCSPEELRTHLERQFVEGMNWQTTHNWEIDHVRPVAAFDLHDEAQQRACFHFSNLQPLWKHLNRKKGAKV